MANANLTRRRMIAIAAIAAGRRFLPAVDSRAGERSRALARIGARRAGVDRDLSSGSSGGRTGLVAALSCRTSGGSNSSSACTGPNSAICTLNRTGILVAPEADMVALLKAALLFSDLTDGAFDPTVQPLWQLYAEHFSSEPARSDRATPGEARGSVGEGGSRWPACERGARRPHPAQRRNYPERHRPRLRDRPRRGHAARAGLSTTLVNMGEIRAIGARPDGAPWRVGLADPDEPGRAHRNRRPCRSRGRDHGRGRFPLRSRRPVHASVRSRDGTQSRSVPHGQRHRADGHRGGCAFDGVQPDAGFADQGHRGRSGPACRLG